MSKKRKTSKAASSQPKSRAKSSADAPAKCRHCRGGAETFRYMKRNYIFDVDKARKIVSDGREPIELEPEDTKYSVDISRIYPEHLPHVKTEYPGIISQVWYQQPDGEILQGQLLIDGHHRAARCLQLDIPFYVHVLSDEESRQIMKTAPRVYQSLMEVSA